MPAALPGADCAGGASALSWAHRNIPGVGPRGKSIRTGGKIQRPKRRTEVRRRKPMAEKPYDRLDGVIWYDGKLVPWGDATLHVLSHGLHYASSVFEGERAYGGKIFKSTEHSERLRAIGAATRFRNPLLGRRDRCGQKPGAGKERTDGGLCAAGRLARLGDDGGLGAKQHDPPRHRHLAVAELLRSGSAIEGHQARSRRLSPSRPGDRAGAAPRLRGST